jgi:beta-lactamase superfamily II metal-dependent hydrolase
MQIRWYGQSAFLVSGSQRIAIDPFGRMGGRAASHGLVFDYPAIDGLEADVLLITHEHADHNAAEVVDGSPVTIRATAGTFESPIGTTGLRQSTSSIRPTRSSPRSTAASIASRRATSMSESTSAPPTLP